MLTWDWAKRFFLDHLNWCHSRLSNGEFKPRTLWFRFYRLIFWPIPDMKPEPCWCCASFRGIIYGLIIGWLMGWAAWH